MKHICVLFFLLLLVNCNKKIDNWDYKITLYSDSTYAEKKDSLFITDKDTIFTNKKFNLTGYFRKEDSSGGYEFGELKNGVQIGKWLSYTIKLNKPVLLIESNYNKDGVLDGKYIRYNPDTKNISELYFYSKGEMLDEQKIFYPNGDLFSSYFQDGKGNYIEKYIVYNKNKDTLYYTDFGIEGTGYLKTYEINSQKLEREGMIINKKWEGLFKDYLWGFTNPDQDSPEIITLEKRIFKNNNLIQQTLIYPNGSYNENTKTYIDSIVITSSQNKDNSSTTKWYSKGKLIKTEIQKN